MTIYTDGACNFNTRNSNNIGGWSYVIVDDKNQMIKEETGRYIKTTNNRMELMAAIKALENITTRDDNILLLSDSAYLVNTMMKGWKRNTNHDLWSRLDCLSRERTVTFKHVKGHDGNTWNERCDKLATQKMNGNFLIDLYE